jgi:carbonic anhydrase
MLPLLCLSLLVPVTATGRDSSHAAGAGVARGIAQRVAQRMETLHAADTHAAPHGNAPATTVRPARAAAPAAAHAHAADTPATPAEVWDALLAGNRRFVEVRPAPRPFAAERAALAKGQHPRAIILACADSRVAPELVFDQSLGDLFVVRTAGNVADAVALGSIEYAVEHLHVSLLVVVGHEKCGAVKAALEPGDMPTPNLQAIVDRIRPATKKPQTCFEGEELLSRCVASNVHQSARDLITHSPVVRGHLGERTLVIQQAVYDLASGVVRPLGEMSRVPQPIAEQ